MADKRMHVSLLRLVRNWLGATSCPSEQLLAAYSDRQLIGEERHAVEHHLADCEACARQIAFLAHSAPSEDLDVPSELLNKVMEFGRPVRSRQIPSWTLVASGATAIMLLFVTTMQVPRHKEIATVATSMPSSAAQPRGTEDVSSSTQVRGSEDKTSPFIYPVAGQRIGTDHVVFRWSPLEQAQRYEIELLTDSGTLLWSTRVSSPQVALPPNIHLSAGRTYYLKLSIHRKNGATQHTKAIGFVAG